MEEGSQSNFFYDFLNSLDELADVLIILSKNKSLFSSFPSVFFWIEAYVFLRIGSKKRWSTVLCVCILYLSQLQSIVFQMFLNTFFQVWPYWQDQSSQLKNCSLVANKLLLLLCLILLMELLILKSSWSIYEKPNSALQVLAQTLRFYFKLSIFRSLSLEGCSNANKVSLNMDPSVLLWIKEISWQALMPLSLPAYLSSREETYFSVGQVPNFYANFSLKAYFEMKPLASNAQPSMALTIFFLPWYIFLNLYSISVYWESLSSG